MKLVTDLSLSELQWLVASLGEPQYRARQVFTWVYQRLATSFDDMSDLPSGLRHKLALQTSLTTLSPVDERLADHGNTVKVLFMLKDNKLVESVLMRFENEGSRVRNTVCVSTQVGCPIGCPFCATGQGGFERNLSPGEIVEQVLYFQRRLREASDDQGSARVTNVVLMGMGEPLANYDSVIKAVETLNSKHCMGIAARHITISTAGLVPQIRRLSQEKLQLELAVSLHAPNNELRDWLVPVNKKYPLEMLMAAMREFFATTGRRPTFEYALFGGVNDAPQHARGLAHLLSGLNCHVNLIAASPTGDKSFARPSAKRVLEFQQELTSLGVSNTLRQSRGLDIEAACGQLRGRWRGESLRPRPAGSLA